MRLPRPRTPAGFAAVAAGGLLVLAVLFYLIAPYNVAARVPHLPGVSALLHGFMQNSVRTWSRGTERPDWADLDSPELVRLGAAHFESGCAPCHGAPGRPPNPLTRGMRPAPPALGAPVLDYDARELHWIVWNGLKFTGMPAWTGTGRDDEPWALVAFLQRYPALDAEAYAALAYGAEAPDDLAASRRMSFGGPAEGMDALTADCARCHGEDGLGRDGTAPRLAGQSRAFMEATLEAYATGRRPSGIMGPIAAALSPDEIAGLAEHYASLAPFGRLAADEATGNARAGAALAARGTARTPSCLSCHADIGGVRRNPLYPNLAGQEERFIAVWLRLWREAPFGGTDYAPVMHEAARWLSDDEIDALAAYFSTTAP